MVKCKPFSCPSISERFMAALEAEGVDPVRIDLLPLILLNHDHMQSYALMDISLDTFPYAGTTTTCESLYMGVPCVTMAGGTHSHNVGVTLLKQLGKIVHWFFIDFPMPRSVHSSSQYCELLYMGEGFAQCQSDASETAG